MSQENVDAFLGTTEAVNRRDVPGLLRFADPEIQFEPQVAVLQGRYEGHEGLRAFYADIFETYEVFQVHFSDVRDLGNQVLALGSASVVGKGSGDRARAAIGDRDDVSGRTDRPVQGLQR